ncbi:hypothetical protein K504DRAFT_460518 [Pleomassaria siparia CBS 279.74]|uniref:GCN5-related N-acetyltransferase Rv2170-like domain-containing protein n=1 Tax=Pleomassaria siparia CBS 279.74 TaxID=1314801 RepID=A0A6G1JYL2_9PLEO|nr:hypothetical protein K504DRAFT_460518 [Pleomassaria siparia CBS 279.74]
MSFKVHNHAIGTGTSCTPILRSALKKSLPYSVNLTYRTQHPNRSPDAQILATFLPHAEEIPNCWAAAYIDRSQRPETELWIFARGEIPGHFANSGDGQQFCPTCKKAVLSLLGHLSTLPVPPIHPDNLNTLEIAKQHEKEFPEKGPNARYPVSLASYYRHLLDPNSVVTLGACHEQLVQICTDAGLVRQEFPGHQARLDKFIFNVADLPSKKDLPQGLRWGEMTKEAIDIMQATATIPRTTSTLLTMERVGVFDEKTGLPIAWAFLGLDGSLVSLYTDQAYRGKGVAKAVAGRIFSEFVPGLAVDQAGNAWAHADVYEGNIQSASVCQSLGGVATWKEYWVRIDITRAGGLSQTE